MAQAANEEGNKAAPKAGAGKAPAGQKQEGKNPQDKKADGKGKKDKKDKKGKKKRGGLLGLLILIVLIIAAGAFLYFSLIFNWGGVRDKLIELAYRLDPEYGTISERIAVIEERERTVAALENRLKNDDVKNEQRKKELDDREAGLNQLEFNRTPIYRRALNDAELEDMKSIGRVYARMSPEDAAERLSALNNIDETAAILYYMAEGNVAAILAVMEPSLAARITNILLHE